MLVCIIYNQYLYKMELTNCTFFKNHVSFEFQVTCYYKDPQDSQSELEHYILANFDVYDDDFIFEEDGGLSFLLTSESIVNVTNLDEFTNFNRVIEMSQKFVNVEFVYSFENESLEDDGVSVFIDVYIKNGIITGYKTVGALAPETTSYDDTILD